MSKLQELEIAAILNYLRVPGRTEIFDFGETGDNLFIILDGVVDVIKPTEKKPKEFSLAKRISDGLLACPVRCTWHLECQCAAAAI